MGTRALLAAMLVFGLPASPVGTNVELPAGLRARLRLVDYVSTEHEQVGLTYRAVLQDKLAVDGNLIAPEKSRALLRLVADEQTRGGVTLDWFAVRIGDDWFEMRAPDGSKAEATVLCAVEDRRPAR